MYTMLGRISKGSTVSSQRYAPLNDDGSDSPPHGQDQAGDASTRRRWPSLAVSFLLGALAASASMLIIASNSAAPDVPVPARRLPEVRPGVGENGLPLHWYNGDCGNSPASARARGCHFDSAIHAWLPRDCLTDDDVEDERLMYRGRDWPYEMDGRNISVEEVQAGDYHNITTSFDMHMTHCMYVLKRMHRVMLDATQKVDSYTVNFNHTTHCVHLLGELAGEAAAGTTKSHKLFVKYPVCL